MGYDLAAALAVAWAFWGGLAGLLAAAGRSWVPLLLVSVGVSVVILAIAAADSARGALRFSALLHGLLLAGALGSYAKFASKRRGNRS